MKSDEELIAAVEGALSAAGSAESPVSAARSRTLESVGASRRPQVPTVCEGCPNSVWFSSPHELKCYCRVMYLTTWSSKDPNVLTHCDGLYLD